METSKDWHSRFWVKVRITGGCWEWCGSRSNSGTGYGNFYLNGRLVRTHRLSWMMHMGEIPKDKCVLHKCDNKTCINPAHLFLGTHSDNMRDCANKGRLASQSRPARGSRHGSAKLIERDVLDIRQRHQSRRRGSNGNTAKLAMEYGVSIEMIRRIIKRLNWSHLDNAAPIAAAGEGK